MKRILPGSSSPSHREGPGIEVGIMVIFQTSREGSALFSDVDPVPIPSPPSGRIQDGDRVQIPVVSR